MKFVLLAAISVGCTPDKVAYDGTVDARYGCFDFPGTGDVATVDGAPADQFSDMDGTVTTVCAKSPLKIGHGYEYALGDDTAYVMADYVAWMLPSPGVTVLIRDALFAPADASPYPLFWNGFELTFDADAFSLSALADCQRASVYEYEYDSDGRFRADVWFNTTTNLVADDASTTVVMDLVGWFDAAGSVSALHVEASVESALVGYLESDFLVRGAVTGDQECLSYGASF